MSVFRISIAASVCLFLTLAGPGRAAEKDPQGPGGNGTIGLSLGTLDGHTTYHISSYDVTGSGVESELEFPLKTMLVGIDGGYVGRDDRGRDAIRINLRFLMNADNGSGQLQDSDWLTNDFDINTPTPGAGFPHPGKDIFSLSDITSQARIIDLRGTFSAWASDRVAVGLLADLLYEHFQFDASNLNQIGFGPYASSFTGSVPGAVLTYETTYVVPSVGLHAEILVASGLRAAIDLDYSPLASAKDKDDHLLRGKLSEGSATGTAHAAAISAAWDIGDGNSIAFAGQYLKIDTSGTQSQTWYRNEVTSTGTIAAGTSISGIGDRITSEQTTLSLLFSHRF